MENNQETIVKTNSNESWQLSFLKSFIILFPLIVQVLQGFDFFLIVLFPISIPYYLLSLILRLIFPSLYTPIYSIWGNTYHVAGFSGFALITLIWILCICLLTYPFYYIKNRDFKLLTCKNLLIASLIYVVGTLYLGYITQNFPIFSQGYNSQDRYKISATNFNNLNLNSNLQILDNAKNINASSTKDQIFVSDTGEFSSVGEYTIYNKNTRQIQNINFNFPDPYKNAYGYDLIDHYSGTWDNKKIPQTFILSNNNLYALAYTEPLGGGFNKGSAIFQYNINTNQLTNLVQTQSNKCRIDSIGIKDNYLYWIEIPLPYPNQASSWLPTCFAYRIKIS